MSKRTRLIKVEYDVWYGLKKLSSTSDKPMSHILSDIMFGYEENVGKPNFKKKRRVQKL